MKVSCWYHLDISEPVSELGFLPVLMSIFVLSAALCADRISIPYILQFQAYGKTFLASQILPQTPMRF